MATRRTKSSARAPIAATLSRQTMAEVPARALAFLRGVASTPDIHMALAAAGYDHEAHREGVRLLEATLELPARAPSMPDRTPAMAMDRLASFADTDLRRARAALVRLHPAQNEVLIERVAGEPGVVRVMAFVERLDRMDRGNAAERAAVATLTARGFTKEVRAQLRDWITAAQSDPTAPGVAPEAVDHTNALLALRAWHLDWSETARAVLSSKEALVRLGLARRRKRGPDGKLRERQPHGGDAA